MIANHLWGRTCCRRSATGSWPVRRLPQSVLDAPQLFARQHSVLPCGSRGVRSRNARVSFFVEGASIVPSGERKRARTAALQVQGIGVPVEVRRHAGARRLTLRVSKTRRTVVVTVPSGCRIEEADRFLRTNIDWVRERLGRVPEPVPLADGSTIPLRGRPHRICFTGPARGACVVKAQSCANGPARLEVTGRIEHAARRLKDWLIAQAL